MVGGGSSSPAIDPEAEAEAVGLVIEGRMSGLAEFGGEAMEEPLDWAPLNSETNTNDEVAS